MRKLTVEEAAQHYGVSTATIRRRVKTEELPHERESDHPNARLWIVVDDDESEGVEPESDGDSTGADAASTHNGEAAYALVTSLKDQITFLQSELDTRAREVSELHQLLRQEQLLREQAVAAAPIALEPRASSIQDDTTGSPRLIHTYLSGIAGGAAPFMISGFISLAIFVWKLTQGINWGDQWDVVAAVAAMLTFAISLAVLGVRWWRSRNEAKSLDRELSQATSNDDYARTVKRHLEQEQQPEFSGGFQLATALLGALISILASLFSVGYLWDLIEWFS